MSAAESLARPSSVGLLAVGVVSLLVTGSCVHVEAHVEAAAAGALTSAGLVDVEIVDVEYRDVRLDGDPSNRDDAIVAVEALDATHDVRWASGPITVTPTTSAPFETAAPASTAIPAPTQQVVALIDDRSLSLSGIVPDETTRSGIVAVASVPFGEDVATDLSVQAVESERRLLRAAGDFATLVAALAETMSTAEVSLDGTQMSVVGVAVGRSAGPAIAGAVRSVSTDVTTDISLPDVSGQDAVDEIAEILALEGITFQSGSAEITAAGLTVIDRVAAVLSDALASDPMLRIAVGGHTDSVGETELNRALSQSRAEAVVDALAERGLDRGRFEAVGFGEAEPIAEDTTEEGRARNRRIEFTIVEG